MKRFEAELKTLEAKILKVREKKARRTGLSVWKVIFIPILVDICFGLLWNFFPADLSLALGVAPFQSSPTFLFFIVLAPLISWLYYSILKSCRRRAEASDDALEKKLKAELKNKLDHDALMKEHEKMKELVARFKHLLEPPKAAPVPAPATPVPTPRPAAKNPAPQNPAPQTPSGSRLVSSMNRLVDSLGPAPSPIGNPNSQYALLCAKCHKSAGLSPEPEKSTHRLTCSLLLSLLWALEPRAPRFTSSY